jgi:hypothetical protein
MTENRKMTCKLRLLREFHIMSIWIKYLYPRWLTIKTQNSGSTCGYHYLKSDLFMVLNNQLTVFLDVTQYNLIYLYGYHIDAKGFWQWCITLRITGFLDFVHCLVF